VPIKLAAAQKKKVTMKRKPEWVVEMRQRIALALSDPSWFEPNGWEMGFLQDIDEKFQRYGVAVRLSDKQESILFRLPLLPASTSETGKPLAPLPRRSV
jgi:hypothetical protein